MYLMVTPNLERDGLTQDDRHASLVLLLTDIRVCFYYLLTSRTLIMGRSRSITTLHNYYHMHPGAAFDPGRAQANQTPAMHS